MELSLPTYLMPELRASFLGYTLPKKLISNSALSNVDFSLSLNNFFTFTSYSGMDPECGGWDALKYPVSRVLSVGVKLTY